MSAAFVMFAQTIAPKKCNTCGKPLAQCQYKGRHPNPAASEKPAKQRTQAAKPVQPSKPTAGYLNGHEWVDLGLPSGTKWATMNVGASSPSDYGNYYAWGETSPKSSYEWSNLKYRLSGNTEDNVKMYKYVTDSRYGTVDGKKKLELSDDAAYVNWGSGWRMPTYAEFKELVINCSCKWTSLNGHNGYDIVGPNGNCIFLPAAWCKGIKLFDRLGEAGSYWCSTKFVEDNLCADGIYFDEMLFSKTCSSYYRYNGRSVRPVIE